MWSYNANDANAKVWSVYFNEIIPYPVIECPGNKSLLASDIGYTRRPIRLELDHKIWWDEITVFVSKSADKIYKQILSYNFHTPFNILNFNSKAEYLVEQIYEKMSENETKLTFKTGFVNKSEMRKKVYFYELWVWKLIFNYKSKDIIEMTFDRNLKNIKAAIELKDKYKRLFPYEPKAKAFY